MQIDIVDLNAQDDSIARALRPQACLNMPRGSLLASRVISRPMYPEFSREQSDQIRQFTFP
jgi:hypothetical protein